MGIGPVEAPRLMMVTARMREAGRARPTRATRAGSASKRCRDRKCDAWLPAMRNRLDKSSVAQCLDGEPSDGETAGPHTLKVRWIDATEQAENRVASSRCRSKRETRHDQRQARDEQEHEDDPAERRIAELSVEPEPAPQSGEQDRHAQQV